MLMPEPDRAVIAGREALVAALRKILPGERLGTTSMCSTAVSRAACREP